MVLAAPPHHFASLGVALPLLYARAMNEINSLDLEHVTGGFSLFGKSAPQPVTAAPGGVAIGGSVKNSVINVGPNSPGVTIRGDLDNASVINGQVQRR